MRIIHYERASLDLMWFLYILFFSCVLALPAETLYNLTVPANHSSIIYRPPEAWTFTALSRPEDAPLRYRGCMSERGTRYFLTSPGILGQNSESVQGVCTDSDTTRPLDDDRLSYEQLICSQQLRLESGCLGPDTPSRTSRHPITIRFRFVGASVYLFGLSAFPSPKSPDTPLTTPTPCASFAIDGQQLRIIAATDFALAEAISSSMNEPIFSHFGLSDDGEHELSVTVSPNSIFLLSHIVYTTKRSTAAKTPKSGHPQLRPTPSDKNTPSSYSSRTWLEPDSQWHQVTLWPRAEEASLAAAPSPNKHNTATFAVAIVTVVGALAIISLAVAFSIIRRRRLARLRDASSSTGPHVRARRISSSSTSSSVSSTSSTSALHADASQDTSNPIQGQQQQHMTQIEGARSFVPRFFPTTTVPPQQVHAVSLLNPTTIVNNPEVQGQLPEQDPPSYDDSMALPSPITGTSPVGTMTPIPPLIRPDTITRTSGNGDILSALRMTLGRARNRNGDNTSGHDTGTAGLGDGGGLHLSYADIPPPTPLPEAPVPSQPRPSTHPFSNTISSYTPPLTPIPLSRSSVPGNGSSHTRDRRSRTPSPPPSVPVLPSSPPLPLSPSGAYPDVPIGWNNRDQNTGESHRNISSVELHCPPGLKAT